MLVHKVSRLGPKSRAFVVPRTMLWRGMATSTSTIPNVKLVNALKHAESPYLQKHKLNPVAWQEWNRDSLVMASQLNKPSM